METWARFIKQPAPSGMRALGAVICLLILTGCYPAPTVAPRSGLTVQCHTAKEMDCSFSVNENIACKKRAPAGYYWEMTAVTDVDLDKKRCSAELRPFSHIDNAGAAATLPQAQGCLYDTQCKGDRICEGGTCVSPTTTAK